jgi:outer membrane receptor for ferrienterochelin and colicins
MDQGLTKTDTIRRGGAHRMRWLAVGVRAGAAFALALCGAERVFAQDAAAEDAAVPDVKELAELSLDDLLNVQVVSATKTEMPLDEAPSIVTVISRRDIEQWGYQSVAEILDQQLGFYLIDDHILPNLAVRGIAGGLRAESSIIKLMIDGQPVSFRSTSGNWLGPELVPITAIDRIEIIRGPASSVYGADAFVGVVHILTRKGADMNGASMRGGPAYVGEHAAGDGDASVGLKLGSFDVLAAGRFNRQNRAGLELPSSSPRPVLPAYASTTDAAQGLQQQSGTGYLKVSLNDKDSPDHLTLTGHLSFLDRGGDFAEWAQLTDHTEDGFHSYTKISRVQGTSALSGSYAASDALTLNLRSSFFSGKDRDGARIDVASQQFYVRQPWSYMGGETQLGADYAPSPALLVSFSGGIGYDVEHRPETTLVLKHPMAGSPDEIESQKSLGNRTLLTPGALVSATYKAWERYLTLTAGFRWDWHTVFGHQWSARFGVASHPLDWLSFKILYGRAFKAPSPMLLYATPVTAGDVVGNPNLEPQYINTVEGQVSVLPNEYVLITSGVAYNHVDDQAEFTLQGLNRVARNVSQLETISWESQVELMLKDYLRAYASYEWVHVARDPGLVGYDARVVQGNHGVYPAMQVRGGVRGTVAKAYLRASAQVHYVGQRDSSDTNSFENGASYTLDPYTMVHATLGSTELELLGNGRFTTLTLIGKNLGDAAGASPGFAGIDYPLYPRSVWLMLAQTF